MGALWPLTCWHAGTWKTPPKRSPTRAGRYTETHSHPDGTQASVCDCLCLSRVVLPDYVLDFGYVLPGKVLTSVLNVTNSGTVPLSLSASTKGLAGTGRDTHTFWYVTRFGPNRHFNTLFRKNGWRIHSVWTSTVFQLYLTGLLQPHVSKLLGLFLLSSFQASV